MSYGFFILIFDIYSKEILPYTYDIILVWYCIIEVYLTCSSTSGFLILIFDIYSKEILYFLQKIEIFQKCWIYPNYWDLQICLSLQ